MKKTQWLHTSKSINSYKTKPIDKYSHQNKLNKTQQKVTYKFKTRKVTNDESKISLQNFKNRLYEIYVTCKQIGLSRYVFLMAMCNFKRLVAKNQKIPITGPQSMACITLAIKFQQECKDPIKRIIQKTKMTKSEVLGAQYYVFEELQFKLPIFDTYHSDLTCCIQTWNEFINQHYSKQAQNFLIIQCEKSTSQEFQNYCNLVIVTDIILAKTISLTQSQYQQCFIVALYFVILHSGKFIYTNFNYDKLFQEFNEKNMKKLTKQKWKQRIKQLDQDYILQIVNNISSLKYREIKGMQSILDVISLC